jgi:hypothetical protein
MVVMNKQEATQLLALIKIAYPTAYKDMDAASKKATVNMWQMSFPDVPYPIMEHAFNHYRMVNKFPPTVAEMVEELKQMNFHATECALIHKGLGDEESVKRYRAIMACTERFKNSSSLGYGNMPNLLSGGEYHVGTSGNQLDREDRLPLLDAGG